MNLPPEALPPHSAPPGVVRSRTASNVAVKLRSTLKSKLLIAAILKTFGYEVKAIIIADEELHRQYSYEVRVHHACSFTIYHRPHGLRPWTFDDALRCAANLFLS